MKDWEIFEKNAVKYLSDKIKIKDISFEFKGGSDSTDLDIDVNYNGKLLFKIEAKKSPSQSGQIVVLLKDGKYEYSDKSQMPKNIFAQKIIDHLNSNLEYYNNPGSKAIEINLNQNILANWIIEHYKSQNVRFIITSTYFEQFNKNFIKILKLEELKSNFEIKAVIRRKRSGTTNVPAAYYVEISELLKNKFEKPFKLSETGKLDIESNTLENRYLGESFFISGGKNPYQIKKRSKTNNPNVIFSLEYYGKMETTGFDILETEIRNLIKDS